MRAYMLIPAHIGSRLLYGLFGRDGFTPPCPHTRHVRTSHLLEKRTGKGPCFGPETSSALMDDLARSIDITM